MPDHTTAERAKRKPKVAKKSSATKKKAAKKLALIRLKGTRNGDKKKQAKRTMA